MRSLSSLALVTAALAYAVIVIGFIVRITGSGMGCGPDWPLCNGRVIPYFTGPDVVIEWTHRVTVLTLVPLTIAVVAQAMRIRHRPGGSGRGGTLGPAALVLGLLVIQSLLGRQAVRVELEAVTVILHLAFALILLAALIVVAVRAREHARDWAAPRPAALDPKTRWAVAGAVTLGGLVVLLGGMTANLGASWACLGFPLCSGQWWPAEQGSGLAHIHWTHRLLAYGLLPYLLWMAVMITRHTPHRRVTRLAWFAFGLATIQGAAGAVMVLSMIPMSWRILHAALGTGVWAALVWLGAVALARKGVARL